MDDFTFLHSPWRVADRRLAPPLGPGSGTWMEFPGHAAARPLFGGADG